MLMNFFVTQVQKLYRFINQCRWSSYVDYQLHPNIRHKLTNATTSYRNCVGVKYVSTQSSIPCPTYLGIVLHSLITTTLDYV